MTRLMCSKDRAEVVAVKSELLRAGIRSEIRSNALADALRITRLEVWVENESDHGKASKVYTSMQTRAKNGHGPVAGETFIDVDDLPVQSRGAGSRGVGKSDIKGNPQRLGEDLEEASLLLEKEIEEVLKREDALSETCAALRNEVESLNRSLSESRAATEKMVSEFGTLRSSLERELAERTQSEAQLKREICELQSRLKTDEEALSQRQQKLESALQQLQTQQSMVVELRKEIVSREQEWEGNKKLVSRARAELAVEKEARLAAEDQAEKSAQAQECLQNQLTEQKNLQEQLRASIGSMNSLRGRLKAKKSSIRG